MSWENVLKDLRRRATSPEAMATRMGSGKYRSQQPPMFPKEDSKPYTGDCKVGKCDATSCMHNQDNKCTLPTVTIRPDSRCGQFMSKSQPMR